MADKFSVPDPSNIRDAILRVVRSGLIARGIPNPNTTVDSDYYIQAEADAQQLSILYANQQILADQTMPDSAVGDDLKRILAIFNLSPREAQPSAGSVVLSSSANTTILTTQQLIDAQGQVYAVTVGGSYANGASVPIQAVSTGVGTNHPQGTVLQWAGAPPSFASATALVAIGGLIGGADIDTDETSRDRLFTYFRNPPQGGNWSQVAQWAVAGSASVQSAYIYPALNGPATAGICVMGSLGWDATNGFTRAVSSATLALAAGYVAARMPEHVDLLTVTPTDIGVSTGPATDVDVSIGLSLPLSVTGGGPGGGWVDAVPCPELAGTATRVTVSVVTGTTDITLTSNDPANCPTSTNIIAGETQICWFSARQWAAGNDPIIVATVLTIVSGVTGAVRVTLSTPFPDVTVGDYIFPASENVQAYAQAWMTAMEDMGPGQWTTHPQVIIRAKRRPLVTSSNPCDLTSVQLRQLSDVGDEVLDVAYLYRSVTTLDVPIDTTVSSPLVIVPRRFGFYNQIP